MNNNFINGGNDLNNNSTSPTLPIDNLYDPPMQPQPNNNTLTQNENNIFKTNTAAESPMESNSETISNGPTINETNNVSQSLNRFQNNDNVNSTLYQNINYTDSISNNSISLDEELLQAYIGKNYEKITTRPFNFAGFFFTTFYMFYRKMFLYAIILFLINLFILNNYFVIILFNVVVGFSVNKVYLYYAKKNINKIKSQNVQKSTNELKIICSNKGGTSVSKIFLGILAEIGIAFIIGILIFTTGTFNILGKIFDYNNWDATITGNKTDNSTLLEDVKINGSICLDSQCTISIEDSGEEEDYNYSANNANLFKLLGDYSDYIKVNIYYIKKGNDKTIVDYKLFLKSNNEDITSVKNEEELRNKIGLYTTGIYTESFTLIKIGTSGAGYKDNKPYLYTNYTLIDSKNNEYEMKYIISEESRRLTLSIGNKYNVTFEVVKDELGYNYYIKNVY